MSNTVANLMIARMKQTDKAQQARRNREKLAITTYLDQNFAPAFLEAVQSVEYPSRTITTREGRGCWELLHSQVWFVMTALYLPASETVTIVSVALGETQEKAELAAINDYEPDTDHQRVDNTQELLDFLIEYDSRIAVQASEVA